MAPPSRSEGKRTPPQDGDLKNVHAQGRGGTIWARVMGPEPTVESLMEDEGGYVDDDASALPDERLGKAD
ncbi:MAG TPA: hypothetical protein VM327_00340 [Candidatus Thermoplasmatota archaeon]|nr:hypothetical protein [Candidatus Thermoplasmatota archaeon]